MANIRNKTIRLKMELIFPPVLLCDPNDKVHMNFSKSKLDGHCLLEKMKFNEIILNFLVSKF